MTEAKIRILIVDDDAATCDLLLRGLATRGFDGIARQNAIEAEQLLGNNDIDVVVTDLQMQGMDGLELCRRIADRRPDIPVVVITGFGSMDSAIAAIRAGAYDFIPKPFDMDQIALVVRRAAEHRALRDEVKRLRIEIDTRRFDDIVGRSQIMEDVFEVVRRVADAEATVLITGESGTGKELVAKALHNRSKRSGGPFVAVNCAAMPESLLESELFGHMRGAFTDAKTNRTGLFLTASGGTLFLDEIGEMPPGMQVKLLRALQERVVRPLGGSTEVPFNTRVVAATNRDLESEVAEGRFREDLFYRINVVRVHVPALRTRGNDILLLAQSFLERFAKQNGKAVNGIANPAAERLLAYPWPGNVRELQNSMERAVALTQFSQIMPDDLPEKVRSHSAPPPVVVESENPLEFLTLDEIEKRYIFRVLQAAGGNKTQVAQILGIDRKTLYRKLERYGEKVESLEKA